MSLSANTLIHFTTEKASLKSILEENFRIFNCLEKVDFGSESLSYIVPMVSFCDIPLSEIKAHITKYGRYGIGMTKEWAVKYRLNPVLYISQNSHLSESYRKAFIHFADLDHGKDGDWIDAQKSLVDVIRYIKNYEGNLTRKGTTIANYRFSDEREWRYVPAFNESCEMVIAYDDYQNKKKSYDSKLENLRLAFEPNDIKYIIIDNEAEIGEFIDHLRRAKGKKYSLDEIERLTTRILTAQQIEQDI